MKKILFYAIIMFLIIIFLPMIITKGCDQNNGEVEKTEFKKVSNKITIKVYLKEQNKIVNMDLEEYIEGVVAAEMPVKFSLEALKAQAVAARTYAYVRIMKLYASEENTHPDADICTDFAHCQAWMSKADATKRWSLLSRRGNWLKIEKAVAETEGTIITYNRKIINPVYHSNSGGRTENSEDVWGGTAEPYLRSVVSKGEEANAEYKNTALIKAEDFCSMLIKEYSDIDLNSKDIIKKIKITDYSAGGRIKTLRVGNLILKGTDIRRIFSLKSTNIKFERQDDKTLKLTTLGNGHGVGMSQWGAEYMAKNGGSFEEILKYYYKGVDLTYVDKITNSIIE